MKNLRKMFAVSMILMQLTLALSVTKSTAAPAVPSDPEVGFTICCDVPPIDTF